jgi:hypothetical protein
MTIAVYMIGHSGYVIFEYAIAAKNTLLTMFARVILGIFPNFEALNIKNYVATGAPVAMMDIYIASGMGIIYASIIMFLAMYLFEKKSFDAV